jgi:hypothetical protein
MEFLKKLTRLLTLQIVELLAIISLTGFSFFTLIKILEQDQKIKNQDYRIADLEKMFIDPEYNIAGSTTALLLKKTTDKMEDYFHHSLDKQTHRTNLILTNFQNRLKNCECFEKTITEEATTSKRKNNLTKRLQP